MQRLVYKNHRHGGFTIVELLVAIVVLALLATITAVVFNGVKDRANKAKIQSDLKQLKSAIMVARVNAGDKTLMELTGSGYSAYPCVILPTTNTLTDPATASACWTQYNYALDVVSNYSSINVRGMKDPWGRPYFFDENEGEGSYCGFGMDTLAAFQRQRTASTWEGSIDLESRMGVPNVRPTCNGG
jgi:prepilin-type N-terminal cleavage/methylation domain-containing protein